MRTTSTSASASFPPEPISVRGARRFLREFSGAHGLSDGVTDAAELALSEVVTNVVLHAHTSFDLQLSLDEDRSELRVEVSDRDPQLPVQRHYAAQATTGRGMELIAALTADCGVQGQGASGKTVWFTVTAAEDADQAGQEDPQAATWDISSEQAAQSAAGGDRVRLLGFPPALWLAAREHHDALMRELALYAAEHAWQTVPAERIALADRARAWISTHLLAELDRLAATDELRSTGRRRGSDTARSPVREAPAALDLDIGVAADAATAFAAMQDVLDTAERLAVAGLLLARPGLPEIVAVRDWACEQAIAQLAGVAPSRWPGVGQHRFTVEVRDRTGASPPDWDASQVTTSARGAVAADDSNRILAVSPRLARTLGWEVDDLVGRRIVALIPAELREAHVAGFTRHLATGETHVLGVPLRVPVLRADGSRVSCDLLIERAPATTGRTVYLAWIDPVEGA